MFGSNRATCYELQVLIASILNPLDFQSGFVRFAEFCKIRPFLQIAYYFQVAYFIYLLHNVSALPFTFVDIVGFKCRPDTV